MNSDRLTVNVCHVADMDGEGREWNGKEGRMGGGGAGREGKGLKGNCLKMWPGAVGPHPKCGPGPPATLIRHCPSYSSQVF